MRHSWRGTVSRLKLNRKAINAWLGLTINPRDTLAGSQPPPLASTSNRKNTTYPRPTPLVDRPKDESTQDRNPDRILADPFSPLSMSWGEVGFQPVLHGSILHGL